MVLTSFNVSLARSRRIQVRFCNYLFIVLLALVVNLCLRIVGALLINALLLVPVATACNLSRNMRQLFWLTTALCLVIGVSGQLLNWELEMRYDVKTGVGGTIVVLGVLLFFLSMLVPWLRTRLEHRNIACKTPAAG
jgi:zinc transport system permease protein